MFFKEIHACGRASATMRSYGHDLLWWWRFLAAVDVAWERATPTEGRDFADSRRPSMRAGSFLAAVSWPRPARQCHLVDVIRPHMGDDLQEDREI
ncbi:site-specific integrase [Rhodococcus qingshengii]|uniref:site-specific integrase n=1 Tax=Rhodococcus qingshengii TaxID=334542 RepID=UPI0036DCAF10